MKKLWFRCLAVLMGLGACTNAAHAQYSSGYSNVGPSAFPIQNTHMQNVPQVPQGYGTSPASSYGASGNYGANYQLVANQVYGNPSAMDPAPAPQMHNSAQAGIAPSAMAPTQMAPSMHSHAPAMSAPHATQMAPAPAPMNYGAPVADSSCATCNQPSYGSTYGYSYPAATVAPNCASCGPAPVSSYDCGTVGAAPVARQWFATADALLFNRVDSKNQPLSFADASYNPDVLGTRDARHGLALGVQTTIGRYFNCGRNAIAASYWGLFPDDESISRASSTAGTFRSRIPYTYMEMAGTPAAPATPYAVYDWYDNAFTHTLERSSEYHNLEVNLLGFAVGGAARNFNLPTRGSMFRGMRSKGCGYCGGSGCGYCGSGGGCNTCGPSVFGTGPCNLQAPQCGSCFNMTWLAGVRWFRFQDDLLYAASLQDTVINRAADDLYYEVNTLNDLVGFQTGFRMDYCVGKRVNLYGRSKVGMYNNRSSLYTRLGTDFQTAYLNDTRTPTNPNNGQSYMFDLTKNQVAFLSELGTGLGVRINCNWTATFGYQAVIATGVATAPDNVRTQFASYTDVQDFHNYGTLILHGFNIGTTYNF